MWPMVVVMAAFAATLGWWLTYMLDREYRRPPPPTWAIVVMLVCGVFTILFVIDAVGEALSELDRV